MPDTADGASVRLTAVAARVKSGDPDRYVSHLFLPESARHRANVLAAFFCELNEIGWRVSEPLMGEMRLQWWRDVLGGPEDCTGHPVADAVKRLVFERPDLVARFQTVLETHSRLFSGDPIDSAQHAAEWMSLSEGDNFFLTALAVHDSGARSADQEFLRESSRQAGRALGLARFLAGESGHSLPPGFCTVKTHPDQAVMARSACKEASAVMGKLPVEWQACFLPLAVIASYLSKYERGRARFHRPAAEVRGGSQLSRYWHIWRAARRGIRC